MTADNHLVCRRCGFSNVAGDQFCGSCGAFLEWEGEPAAPIGSPVTTPLPPPAGSGPNPDVPQVRAAGGPPPVAPPVTPWGPTGSAASSAPTEMTPVPSAAADGALLRCPACGIANAAGRTFCQSCGTKLAEAPRVAEVTAAQIAAAVNAPARPVTVQTTTVRAASGEPKASGGGIGKWIVLMAVIGVLIGAGAVVASQLLKGPGPASVASTGPSAAPSGGAATAGPSGDAPSAEAPSAETPSGETTAPPSAEPKPAALALTGAVASSVVGDLEKFQPGKAIDGNPKTCWQEGSPTEKGEWIEVTFAPAKVTSLVITNGYNASKALYKGNKRLKDIAISVNGGSAVKIRLDDTGTPQKVNIKDVAGANTLRITILSTYGSVKTSVAGTPFDDAALGEIVVMGVAGS